MTTKVAIVTGSNKGIGYVTVRGLCEQFCGDVYVTARDESRGQEAVAKLQAEGLQPHFHQLDINDVSSIQRLSEFIKEKYGGLDVLVNNAAIAYGLDSPAPVSEQAEQSVHTNFRGLLNVCNGLFPLLRQGARVVNLSTFESGLTWQSMSEDKKQKFIDCKTVADVGDVMKQYVNDAKSGNLTGWAPSCYGTSKVGVSLITPIQQRFLDPDGSKDIVINACCPGYVATDMSSYNGYKTVEEGADTPIYLAVLPPKTDIRGKFVTERKVVDWRESKQPDPPGQAR